MKTFSFLVLCMVSIILAGCPDRITTPHVSSIKEGSIVYTVGDNTNNKLIPYINIIDTTGTTLLTISDSVFSVVVFSEANGKMLYAKILKDASKVDFIVANTDNTSAKVIYTRTPKDIGLDDQTVLLSPDGSKVVYASKDSGATNYNLWIMNSDGTGKGLLSSRFQRKTISAFSSDSKRLVFATTDHTIDIANTDLSGSSTICTADANEISWRNGHNQIAFSENGIVYTVNTSGPALRHTIDSGATPMWSDDGTTLAYSNQTDIITTSDEGLTKTNLTSATATLNKYPQWSKDGKKIVCISWVGIFSSVPVSLRLIDVASAQSSIIATPIGKPYFVK